jgi:diguanylate cyclase (GGDEF)-like protein/PAS domain S-box-containing protein
MSNLSSVYEYTKTFKVLYIEDNKNLQEQVFIIFNELFDQVDVANDGQEALEIYNKFYDEHNKYYDLVITDLHMPKMDGEILIQNIMQINVQQVILVISAYSDPSSLISLLNIGVNGFLVKPIDEEQMINSLKKVSNIINNQKKLKLCNDKIDILTSLQDDDINKIFEKNQILINERDAFETLYQKSSDGIVLLKDNKILDCNNAAINMLQYENKDNLLETTLVDHSPLIQPNGYRSETLSKKSIEYTLRTGQNRFEWVYEKKDGSQFWVEVVMTKLNYLHGQQVIHTSWRDISKTKELEEELLYLATKDYLTGISNRRDYFDRAKKVFDKYDDIYIVMMDLDRFKKINDTYGHKAGDEVLKMFTNTIKRSISDEVIFARLGGEEFVLLFYNEDKENVLDIIDKLRVQIENLDVKYEEKNIKFTTSMGIASKTSKNDTIDSVMNIADQALYDAKNGGRNTIKFRS